MSVRWGEGGKWNKMGNMGRLGGGGGLVVVIMLIPQGNNDGGGNTKYDTGYFTEYIVSNSYFGE